MITNSFLDKTISVRQIFRWTRRALYLAIPLYVVLFFFNAWELETGSVSLNNSPFKDRIPTQCLGYAGRSFGTPGGRTTADNLLLQRRLTRHPIEGLANGVSLAPVCLGYAVLGGLHGSPWVANFTEQWVDAQGDPIVTVRVEYTKSYVSAIGSKK